MIGGLRVRCMYAVAGPSTAAGRRRRTREALLSAATRDTPFPHFRRQRDLVAFSLPCGSKHPPGRPALGASVANGHHLRRPRGDTHRWACKLAGAPELLFRNRLEGPLYRVVDLLHRRRPVQEAVDAAPTAVGRLRDAVAAGGGVSVAPPR